MLKFLYKHYLLTFLIVVYYMVLFGSGTYQMFFDISKISGGAATAYATLAALPPAAIGLIQWRLGKNDRVD